jgi:membrane protease YdiL (CAAX protease family)
LTLTDPRWTPRDVTTIFLALYVLTGLVLGDFDPYAFTIFVGITFASLAALAAAPRAAEGLTGIDLAVWLLLWIPFDLRWNAQIFPGRDVGIAYNWWAIYLVVIAIIGWGRLRQLPGFDYRLIPRGGRDFVWAGIAFLGVLVTCVPPGLLADFIHYPSTVREPSIREALIAGPAIFLTIALPEEIFFRGVLQTGLERWYGRGGALVLASLAFGLMHWNNVSELKMQLVYCGLATVAGGFYGLAYRRGGSLFAAALCHALVDLIWHLFLQ